MARHPEIVTDVARFITPTAGCTYNLALFDAITLFPHVLKTANDSAILSLR